jgi:general stress protein 26
VSTPTTSDLDARFSEPGAVATTWEQARRELEAAELFWITTVRADGRPHTAPLVAVWLDDELYFCTGPHEQKAVNIADNPHVNLLTGSAGWNEGLDLVVEGDAIRVTGQDELERLAQAWTAKWDGRWQYQAGQGGFLVEGAPTGLVFGVRPKKVLAFGKGTFSQTRHRF